MLVGLGDNGTHIREHALIRSLMYCIGERSDYGRIVGAGHVDELLESFGVIVGGDGHEKVVDGSGVIAELSTYAAAAYVNIAVGRHHCHCIVHILRSQERLFSLIATRARPVNASALRPLLARRRL